MHLNNEYCYSSSFLGTHLFSKACVNKFLLWGYKALDIKSSIRRCKSHWKSSNLSLASTFSSFLPQASVDQELWPPWCAGLSVHWIAGCPLRLTPEICLAFSYYLMLVNMESSIHIAMLKAYLKAGQKHRAQAVLTCLSDNKGNWPNFCEWNPWDQGFALELSLVCNYTQEDCRKSVWSLTRNFRRTK